MSTRPVDPAVAAMAGPAALPRKNGELVFDAPWQSRAFGLAVSLRGRGLFDWREFQARLIEAVGRPPSKDAPEDQAALYYSQWLTALEALLLSRGVLTPDELAERRSEFESGKRSEVF